MTGRAGDGRQPVHGADAAAVGEGGGRAADQRAGGRRAGAQRLWEGDGHRAGEVTVGTRASSTSSSVSSVEPGHVLFLLSPVRMKERVKKMCDQLKYEEEKRKAVQVYEG